MRISLQLRSAFSSLAAVAALVIVAGRFLSGAAEPLASPTNHHETGRQLLPSTAFKVSGGFWGPKLQVYRERTIPHSWNYMGWELRALQKAGGQEPKGDLNGTWGEANLHKFLETIGHALAQAPDPALEQKTEEVIALLKGAQQPDGYLHAFVTNSKKQPWDPGFLDGSHDGYVLGHMIEAALAYYEATGRSAFLVIACKAADQAWENFLGPNGRPGFCGHAELEMALVELYRVVPKREYLDLAKALVECRGRNTVKPFSETPRAYFQDQVPLREQKTLEGHAVRAVFFATGVADLALETGDPDYRLAANRFWDSTARRRMNIAGSIGPRKEHEAFGEDYELPNNGYYESCAACGLLDFAQRMFLLEGRAEAADVMERVLYNAVLHGISLDGTNSYYTNPLSDRDNPRYNSWVCCPPNLSRTLFQVGRYAFARSQSNLWINLFVAGKGSMRMDGGPLTVLVETDYPWSGAVKFRFDVPTPMRFGLNLRRPSWCSRSSLKVNGESPTTPNLTETGYVRIDRMWKAGDLVEFEMDMPVLRIEAHPNIKDCAGKIALQRGPIVYGFEGLDNEGSSEVELGAEPASRAKHFPDLLGGVTVIDGVAASSKPFRAIPFFALANRGKSSQEVWVKQRGLKPSDEWWLGELYRPLRTQ